MGKRVMWCICGVLAAEAVTLVIRYGMGWRHFPDFSVALGPLVVLYGEHTGRLKKIQCQTRPLTIFDGKVPRT